MYKIIGGDGKEYGPISAEQLRQWISEGRVNAQTMIQPEGVTGWSPLSQFPEFGIQAATAGPVQAPASLKVFGIINIVWGSLKLLCTPLSLVGMAMAAKQPNYHPPETSKLWLVIALGLALIGGVILLANGIGLCRAKEWARKLAIYYAGFVLGWSIVEVIVNIKTGSMESVPPQFRAFGMVILVVVVLITWAYYGLTIYFLTRPQAKAACH